MTTKKEIIAYINEVKDSDLTLSNSSYSKINKSKDVWWSNIATSKFRAPVNLLLQIENGVFWIVLPVGFVNSIEKKIKIRQDKDAVDLEISTDKNVKYLHIVKYGGTRFDFKRYVKVKIVFN